MFKISINTFFFLQFLNILLIRNQPINDYSVQKKWDENILFQYIKDKFLSESYSNQIINLKYMIIDPNEYLKNDDVNELAYNFELLYEEFKVSSFFFIINSIKENTILNYQLRDFMSKINYEINKYKKNYDEKKIISALFAVENNKMFIRVGSSCRPILPDSEAMKLLRKRKEELNNKNVTQIMIDLSRDILLTYRQNYEKSLNKAIPSSLKIIFYIIIFTLFGYIYYHFIKNNFSTNKYSEKFIKIEMKSNFGKNIKEFINKNINKSIKIVMNNNCLICLESYDNKSKNENILFELEESSNERIILPCQHIFHLKCISQWFLKYIYCPLCKSKFEINKEEDGKINIINYNLNHKWIYNNSFIFKNIIKDFLRIQKTSNPEEINEDLYIDINNNCIDRENNTLKNVKIENMN